MRTPAAWEEFEAWAHLLADTPIPRQMQVGPGVVDALVDRFAPPVGGSGMRWGDHGQFFGVPIITIYILAPGFWRALDQYGKVMQEGRYP
jgi:hypothetical protein